MSSDHKNHIEMTPFIMYSDSKIERVSFVRELELIVINGCGLQEWTWASGAVEEELTCKVSTPISKSIWEYEVSEIWIRIT